MPILDNPLRELMLMQERMTNLLEENIRRRKTEDEPPPDLAWSPDVDVVEEDGAFVFFVDLPGVDRDDVRVDVDRNHVTIEGERRPPEGADLARARQRERFYGRFERTFDLGSIADVDRVTARYRGGVLTITVPKHGDEKLRRVKITVD